MDRTSGLVVLAFSLIYGSTPVLAVGTQADVLRKIHLTNQMEIKAGQLAEEKGFSVKVRDYGKRLVKDHTQADREVQAAAKREKIDLSAPIPEVDEAMGATELNLMNKLQAANGADFDRVFAESMDSAHQEAIRSLQTAQKQYQGTETAKVIGQILPKLEKHERIAEKIEQRAE